MWRKFRMGSIKREHERWVTISLCLISSRVVKLSSSYMNKLNNAQMSPETLIKHAASQRKWILKMSLHAYMSFCCSAFSPLLAIRALKLQHRTWVLKKIYYVPCYNLEMYKHSNIYWINTCLLGNKSQFMNLALIWSAVGRLPNC